MKKALAILFAALLTLSATGCQQKTGEDHQHSFTVKDMAIDYLAAEQNCLTGELYYYACSICGKASEYVWSASDPLGHDLQPDGCTRCEWYSTASGTLSTGQQWAYYSDGSLHFYGKGALPSWSESQLLSNEIPWRRYNVRTVVLPQGITTVGDRSFSGMTNLTTVTIPSTVTTIGESAFEGCKSLENVKLPDMLNLINRNAFRNCASIRSLIIPRYTVYMEDNVFAGCSSLESIGVEAFANTHSLQELVLPEGLKRIEDRAFVVCNKIKSK